MLFLVGIVMFARVYFFCKNVLCFLFVIMAKMVDKMHKYTVLSLENAVDKTSLLVEL